MDYPLRFLISLSFFLFFFISSTFAFIKVNPSTGQLIDEQGRERIFHGVNVV
jgi:hypothetical protein